MKFFPFRLRFTIAASSIAASLCGFILPGRPAMAQAPVLTAEWPANVSGGTATLGATVTANGAATSVYFQYGATTSYGSTTGAVSFPSATASVSDNAESYSTWSYGANGGTGLGPATYLEGVGGGIFLVNNSTDAGRQIDGNDSFGVFAGSASGNTQGMDRQILNAQSAGTLTLSCRFDVSNTVAFSGFNLKYGQGTHFGDYELISVGIIPASGNNTIVVNGGAQSINLGSSIPGQIVDFTLTYDCLAGTYTLGAKFRSSGSYTNTSGSLKLPASAGAVPVTAAYLGFGNFNTGGSQNFIADDLVLNTSGMTTSGTMSVADLVAGLSPTEGLTPDTAYHFRAVAASASGTTYGADATFGFPLQPPGGSAVTMITSTSGNYVGSIYTNSGHIAVAGPDLSGDALNNVETFEPPAVTINASVYYLGPVLSSTAIPNGLQVVQALAGLSATTQLTFNGDGILHYNVPVWPAGVAPSETQLTVGSSANEHFFGFGEKFDSVDQAGNKVHMLSNDDGGTKGDSSYKPVPFFMSNQGYGFHLDSTAESWFDMRNTYADRYVIQNLYGALSFYLISGPKLTDVLTRFTSYVGRPYLPPPWAFGTWISSDIWRTGGEVKYALSQFRAMGIPVSGMVFDSPWEVGYNDFAWNLNGAASQFGASGTYQNPIYNGSTLSFGSTQTYSGFSSVSSMMSYLQSEGVKLIPWFTAFINTSSDADNAYGTTGNLPAGNLPGQNTGPASDYATALAYNYFVGNGSGGVVSSGWWKGTGSLVDFTNPAAVTWYTGMLQNLITNSDVTTASGGQEAVIGGFKTDGGEGTNEGGAYIPTTATFANGQTGLTMQNGYAVAYQKTISSVVGTNGVLIGRSGFAGTGAAPGCWSGDNEPNFNIEGDGLDNVMIAGISAGLSGFVIWGSDIGGYEGGPFESDPSDLFQRWAQFGAFCPLMEMHRTVDPSNLQQYPWGYSATALGNYITYARLHTQLFPFIYSYATEAANDGLPIIRALQMMYQTDPNAWGLQHTYMFGNEFLVAPQITLDATTRTVYLPAGTWIDYWTNAQTSGSQSVTWANSDPTKIPLYVKQGSIIPMLLNVPQSLCTANYINNPSITTMDSGLEFQVYPNSTQCSFNLYDGSVAQCTANGTVTTLSLTSTSRTVIYKVLESSAPAGVELNGVKLPNYTSQSALNAAGFGWFYDSTGGFLYVRYNHTGGTALVMFGPSTAGDGITDSWRLYYFGSATPVAGVSDAGSDPDGTGLTNLQKYLAGLNPTNPQSQFVITSTVAAANGNITIEWQSVYGISYHVQWTANLPGAQWQTINPGVTGDGTVKSWTDDGSQTGGAPASSASRFYRVTVP